jgi:hypothetical protein
MAGDINNPIPDPLGQLINSRFSDRHNRREPPSGRFTIPIQIPGNETTRGNDPE